MALKIAAHNLPPVVTLRRFHVDKLNAYPTFFAMADDGAHLQLSGVVIVMNAEMNFNFRSRRVLGLTQNAHAHRPHICQETGRELVGRAKQNAPIGGAPCAASAFGRWIVRQMSNRNSRGPRGCFWPNGCSQKIINNLLMECECRCGGDRIWRRLKSGCPGEKDCAGVSTWASVCFGPQAC